MMLGVGLAAPMRLCAPSLDVLLRDESGTAALLDYYPEAGFFAYGPSVFSSEEEFWSAIGGVASGDARVIGPYDDPAGTNLLTNGDFASDTTGWATFSSMAIASVGGELEMTPTGNLSAVSQAKTGLVSRAFKFTSTLRRGTTARAAHACLSINNAPMTSGIYTPNVTTTSPTTNSVYGATSGSGNLWCGARCNSASGDGGTILGDDFSLIEAWPAPEWPRAAATFVAWGTTPAESSGNKVLYQEGSASERDRIRLVWGADGHLFWIVTVNNVVRGSFDLGVVAPATPFRTVLAASNSSINATFNGVLQTAAASPSKPGAACAWLKRSFTGEDWDGSVERLAVISSRVSDTYAQHLSVIDPDNVVWAEGDSYMAGAGGVSLKNTLAAETGRVVISTAAGGATMSDILARVQAAPHLASYPFIMWDGSPNSYGSVAAYLAQIDLVVSALGSSKFLLVPPVAVSVSAPTSAGTSSVDTAAIRDGLVAAYGASRVLDSLPVLNTVATIPDDNDWITYGYVPGSLLIDTVHLNQSAMDAMAEAISGRITDNGW